ncbi:putative 3-oxoacyl-(Acyl carrier) synthase domain protein, partial [Escherichia coli 97.1742]
MIYISAVGMINALGNNLDEIATNLTRGVAPGMRPRAGWLQGHPQAVLAGVDGELPLIPEKFAAHRSRCSLSRVNSTSGVPPSFI